MKSEKMEKLLEILDEKKAKSDETDARIDKKIKQELEDIKKIAIDADVELPKEAIEKIEEFLEMIRKEAKNLARGIVKESMNGFKEKEIDELIAIYSSPVFKKFNEMVDFDKARTLAKKLVNSKFKELTPELDKILDAE